MIKLKGKTFIEKLEEMQLDEKLDKLFDTFNETKKVGLWRILDKENNTAVEFQIVLETDQSKFDKDTPIVCDISEIVEENEEQIEKELKKEKKNE